MRCYTPLRLRRRTLADDSAVKAHVVPRERFTGNYAFLSDNALTNCVLR